MQVSAQPSENNLEIPAAEPLVDHEAGPAAAGSAVEDTVGGLDVTELLDQEARLHVLEPVQLPDHALVTRAVGPLHRGPVDVTDAVVMVVVAVDIAKPQVDRVVLVRVPVVSDRLLVVTAQNAVSHAELVGGHDGPLRVRVSGLADGNQGLPAMEYVLVLGTDRYSNLTHCAITLIGFLQRGQAHVNRECRWRREVAVIESECVKFASNARNSQIAMAGPHPAVFYGLVVNRAAFASPPERLRGDQAVVLQNTAPVLQRKLLGPLVKHHLDLSPGLGTNQWPRSG